MSVTCFIKNCQDSFSDLDQYKTHLRVLHSKNEMKKFVCTLNECGSVFDNIGRLFRHLNNTHNFSKIKNKSVLEPPNSFRQSDINAQSKVNINKISDNNSNDDAVYNEQISDNECQIDDKKQKLEEMFSNFVIKLHSKNHLTKSCIQEIISSIKSDIIDPLCEMTSANSNFINLINSSYSNFNTLYKLKKYMSQRGHFTKGIDHTINYKNGLIFKKGRPIVGEIKEKICIMPIKNMVTSIFSVKDIFESTRSFARINHEVKKISSIADGLRWKSIVEKYSADSVLIPFELYSDDIEPDNALGSNAGTNKISTYFIRFPTMPPHLLSSIQYIFEVLLHCSSLKKDMLDNCLEELIEVFKELENGIPVIVEEKEIKIHFIMLRILGDNLALNELLGFTLSFNSTMFCRFCTMTREDSKKMTKVHPTLMRSRQQYDTDLLKNDLKTTGLRQNCLFNVLDNFHCIDNFVVDIMHDLFEGIIKYDVAMCLMNIIEDKNLDISLNTINNLKQGFDYNDIDIGNLSKPLSEKHLKQGALKMSASETMSFIFFLPLMIGHLIPKNNKYWKLILILIDITDAVMMSSFDDDTLKQLHAKIIIYLETYINLFGQNLRPKHHFLLHYVDCIYNNGPLRTMMTFAFESKNREIKEYAKATSQRVNLAHSLSYKCAFRFNNFLNSHKDGFHPITSHKKVEKVSNEKFHKTIYYHDIKRSNEYDFISTQEQIFRCNLIIHKKTTYKCGFFILKDSSNPINCFKIIDILYCSKRYFLILEKFTINRFVKHLRSHELGLSSHTYDLITIDSIIGLPFNIHKTVSGKEYFRIKNI
ncbi:hypothetical protein PVAND_014296 [Polypedilum vanderplanki]|uniref:C2H2-type domain-containing protein n=1 Tax=Polypedilum vanderplanki TaxID=319348 RepID=A0A9J6CT47_POLVA|nr:hypothetical protein PVAND_014296 [Polypedilum vanderplanki]